MEASLFDQIVAEMARICPDEPPIGFSTGGGFSEVRLLFLLRSVPDGAGEMGVAHAMDRYFDRLQGSSDADSSA